jgi:hypothetical protein
LWKIRRGLFAIKHKLYKSIKISIFDKDTVHLYFFGIIMPSDLLYKPRPCERCGAGQLDPEDFEDNWDDELKSPAQLNEAPMCSEFHMAYGMVTWLCYKCRSDWHKVIDDHPLSNLYAEAQLALDFWKARVGPNTSKDELKEGLALLRKCTDIEKKINSFANHWLVTG